jgi:hypothetical protein
VPDKEIRGPDPVAEGRRLVPLQDTGNYITKLPKAEHESPEWQAAMEALILAVESDGRTMLRGLASCER